MLEMFLSSFAKMSQMFKMPSTQANCQEKANPLHRTWWNIYKIQFRTDPGTRPKCKIDASFLEFKLLMKFNKTEKKENSNNFQCPIIFLLRLFNILRDIVLCSYPSLPKEFLRYLQNLVMLQKKKWSFMDIQFNQLIKESRDTTWKTNRLKKDPWKERVKLLDKVTVDRDCKCYNPKLPSEEENL